MCPVRCKNCEHGHNCINGRYCDILKKYVEYDYKIICNYEN